MDDKLNRIIINNQQFALPQALLELLNDEDVEVVSANWMMPLLISVV